MIREILMAAVTLGSLTSIGVAADAPEPTRQESRADQVQRLATPLIESGVVPSMVIGLYDAGRVEVYGFGKTGAPRDSTPDGRTIYEIGSITKVFTGLLLANAVERGTVKFQDPLSKLLPEGEKKPCGRHGWVQ